MKNRRRNLENIIKVILIVLIGINLLRFGAEQNPHSLLPLLLQIPLLISLFFENKLKVPLLAIWTAFIFVNALTAGFAIVLSLLQLSLGFPEKAHFDFARIAIGAMALVISISVYRIILKEEARKFGKKSAEVISGPLEEVVEKKADEKNPVPP